MFKYLKMHKQRGCYSENRDHITWKKGSLGKYINFYKSSNAERQQACYCRLGRTPKYL